MHRGDSKSTGVGQVAVMAAPESETGRVDPPFGQMAGVVCRYAARALGWPHRRWASPRIMARCLRSRARTSGSVVWALRQRM